MKPLLIDNETVKTVLDAQLTIEAIESALRESRAGALEAPARSRVQLSRGDLVFTAAGSNEGFGFRAYDTFGGLRDDQVTVVWDRDGSLQGVVVGPELGRRRTGALGAAAAVRLLGFAHELSVGVIGAGSQAYAQLWAIASVRTIKEVRCFRRDAGANVAFASRVTRSLELSARTVGSAREAVEGADLVIVATGCVEPVLQESWVSDGTTVFTLGPKSRGATELPPSLYERGNLLTTDAPSQILGEGEDSVVYGRVVKPLADLPLWSVTDVHERVIAQSGVQIYLSEGLAGTEVLVAKALIARLRRCEKDGLDSFS